MKDFITALDPNYQLDKYHIKNNVVVFYMFCNDKRTCTAIYAAVQFPFSNQIIDSEQTTVLYYDYKPCY